MHFDVVLSIYYIDEDFCLEFNKSFEAYIENMQSYLTSDPSKIWKYVNSKIPSFMRLMVK